MSCLAIAGCGEVSPSRVQRAYTTHELTSSMAPPPQRASGASPQAVAAIQSFAASYINWDASSVAAHMRELAQRSIGQARSAMELAAAQTAQDYELQRGGIANSGTVEAVALLPHRRDQYVVVTLEHTTATNTTAYQGLRPAWHVAVANVVRLAGQGWVVSRWQPET